MICGGKIPRIQVKPLSWLRFPGNVRAVRAAAHAAPRAPLPPYAARRLRRKSITMCWPRVIVEVKYALPRAIFATSRTKRTR